MAQARHPLVAALAEAVREAVLDGRLRTGGRLPAERGFAAERADPVLAQDGEPGPGLPELRSLIARRHTDEGLPTRPEQILVTSGARAALALLVAHLRPRVAAVLDAAYGP
ncbi:hypothetical protein ACWDSL_23735 [Streptomyces sp. NPDC000941]